MTQDVTMSTKEELTKLIMASYDQGVKDAQQDVLATLEQVTAAVRADEREACAKVCIASDLIDFPTRVEDAAINKCAKAIRARGEA